MTQANHFLRRVVFSAFLWGLSLLFLASSGFAQTPSDLIEKPDFTIERLEVLKDRQEADQDLTEDQKTQILAYYDSAILDLKDAEERRVEGQRLQRELDNAPKTIEELRAEIKEAQNAPVKTEYTEPDNMTGEELLRLERDLITREGDMRTLRAEITRYENALAVSPQRNLRGELAKTREEFSALSGEILGAVNGSGLEPLEEARLTAGEAHLYDLAMTISVLELEVAGQSSRQQILTSRLDLARLNAERVEQDVIALQNQTGKRRVSEAEQVKSDAENALSAVESAHPLVIQYAGGNIVISETVVDIARRSGRYPKLRADARSRLDNIQSDLGIARQLTDLERIDRQSSEILRRLRDQRPSINSIKSRMAENQSTMLTATQAKFQAQEQLGNMPIGQVDIEALLKEWRAENPEAAELNETDVAALNSLFQARRDLLGEVSSAALVQAQESESLSAVQESVLKTTTSLNDILDQNLLWLPSVNAIDFQWPQRIIRGTQTVFSGQNFGRVLSVFGDQLQRLWLVVLLAGILVGTALLARRRLRLDIIRSAQLVGRVQKDDYWVTPNVIILCAMITAPIPIILLLVGFMFRSSGAPDVFITSLGQTGIELSGFTWFFLMWKEWSRDKSLFAAHYKMPSEVGKTVSEQLKWFIPVAGVLIALVTLTQNSREPDVYEGFSLLVFIMTACALAYFGFKILWLKQPTIRKAFSENSIFWRYRRLMIFFFVGMPVIAAMLAASGYYDTARELLSRLFFSSGLVIATYVVYGVVRRTVLIAQRRLALRQAMERREKLTLAREEMEAAEERGENVLPQVNYDEIDLETISRQTSQLMNTAVIIGFVILMWMFWKDLFPALSIFDDVNLWATEWAEIDGERTAIEYVSLWNLIQSLTIAVLTFIAAKNLPGFLEVFVLNRSNLDRGSRYAVVSILGYIIIAIGFVWAFNKLGMDWSQLQWIVAALGVGIGFGLQEIIANFISGLILLFERPIRVGDYITIGDKSGTVNRIQIRATTLSDLDNREIFIPNRELITQKVTNWTLTDSITRIIIPVGVAYGSDTDQVRQIMFDVIKRNKRILDKPKSNVFFLGFGESSLDFEIRLYVRSVEDRFSVSHEIHTEINKELANAGVSIPFPQRDLNIITQSPQVKDVVPKAKPKPKRKPSPKPKAT